MKGVVAFFVIGIGAPVILLIAGPFIFSAEVWERLTNESPEAKITAYVQAVARGDEQGALLVWQLPDVRQLSAGWSFTSSEDRCKGLADHRQKVTSDLVGAGITSGFSVLSIEWWGTCRDPHLVKDPRDAGAARVRMDLRGRAGGQSVYAFDVITREYPYWTADTYPPRAWVPRDVYLDGQDTLYWDHQATPVAAT